MSDLLETAKIALADRYAIEREVGSGGMATVYLAQDLRQDRAVAVKVLRYQSAPAGVDDGFISLGDGPGLAPERFLREIEIAGSLTHPHILPVYESGEAAGLLYYVMPYVTGESLRARIKREEQLPIEDALQITEEVASALSYAHSHGVVHRDIKPANILLSSGHAVVVDFGIARAISAARTDDLTQTGRVVGTPAYSSPEQASGSDDIDGRSDIYSLGCVLYEMLVGEPPFTGPTPQTILAKRLTEPVPQILTVRETVSEQLQAVVMRALAKSRADRFSTAAEFGDALAASRRTSGLQSTVSVPSPVVHDEKSILVLPFVSVGADSDSELFSDGLTDEVIAALSGIKPLRVIPRTSAMRLKGTTKDIKTIGRELGVRYVLEGGVRKSSDDLRITAKLIDAVDEQSLWVGQFDGKLDGVFDIQREVSAAVVEALQLETSPEEDRTAGTSHITDIQAHECYLRARQESWHFTEETIRHALQYLTRASEIIGDNALLYAGMAEAYFLLSHTGASNREMHLDKVEQYARKILELDPESAAGHCFFGLVQMKQIAGREEGIRHMQRAVENGPDNPSAVLWLGVVAASCGKTELAENCADKLLSIDPLSPMSHWCRGWVHMMNGQFDLAVDPFHEARQMDAESQFYRFFYAHALAATSRRSEAFSLFDLMQTEKPNNMFTWLGTSYKKALSGDAVGMLLTVTPEFIETAKWHDVYSLFVAQCYALVDERAEALDWLDHAVEHGFINYPFLAEHDPFLEAIRGEPRFEQILTNAKSHWSRLAL